MFDPLTVAFEIKCPWKKKASKIFPEGYRDTLIRVWHKDPCTDGSDNSCDWHGQKRKLNKKEKAIVDQIWHMETVLDNRPFYPDHEAHLRFQKLKQTIYEWRKRPKFRLHPRYHIWHWRIQVPALQKLIRYLFAKCCFCKKGFKYNESVIGNWDGDSIWHNECDHNNYIKK